MEAKRVIEEGSHWRVGNRDKIRGWKDTRLLAPTTYNFP